MKSVTISQFLLLPCDVAGGNLGLKWVSCELLQGHRFRIPQGPQSSHLAAPKVQLIYAAYDLISVFYFPGIYRPRLEPRIALWRFSEEKIQQGRGFSLPGETQAWPLSWYDAAITEHCMPQWLQIQQGDSYHWWTINKAHSRDSATTTEHGHTPEMRRTEGDFQQCNNDCYQVNHESGPTQFF